MKTFGGVVGKSFKTEAGVSFKVLAAKMYSKPQITSRYRNYLMTLKSGLLVSVPFYGTPTPLVTVGHGVVRLTQVRIGRKVCDKSSDISIRLGVAETKKPLTLRIL